MIRLATWNVNSLRARLPSIQAFIQRQLVDVICFQELKCTLDQFPHLFFQDLGYNLAVYGQKTFNGVAIASKFPIQDIQYDLSKDARFVVAKILYHKTSLTIGSIYCPNGQNLDSEKFLEKLNFFESLRQYLSNRIDESIIIGGDFNVAPTTIDSFHDDETLLCSLKERRAFFALLHLGFKDAYRVLHKKDPGFTWWDYRQGHFEKNKGMRIDHFLVSPKIADRVLECRVICSTRSFEKPSDHAPLYIEVG